MLSIGTEGISIHMDLIRAVEWMLLKLMNLIVNILLFTECMALDLVRYTIFSSLCSSWFNIFSGIPAHNLLKWAFLILYLTDQTCHFICLCYVAKAEERWDSRGAHQVRNGPPLPTRSNLDRSRHVGYYPLGRQPFPSEDAFNQSVPERQFGYPRYYEDTSRGMKRPYFMGVSTFWENSIMWSNIIFSPWHCLPFSSRIRILII